MSDAQTPVPTEGGKLQKTEEPGAILSGMRKIASDSAEFSAAVSTCLPPDAAATILECHLASRRRYRRLEILLILLGLGAVGCFIYFYFPRPVSASRFVFLWSYRGPRFPDKSPWQVEYRRACDEFAEEHYEETIRILKTPLDSMGTRIPAGHDELFFLYFSACERAGNDREWRNAVAWARRLAECDPDNSMWRYFLVMSLRRSLGPCPAFYQKLHDGALRDSWERILPDVNQGLKEIELLERKLDYRNRPIPRQAEIVTQLTLFRAELLVLRWMLEGGRGKAKFPDNQNAPGVDAREEAWRSIQARNEEPFVNLRIFILELLLRQDSWYNSIYWNGSYHSTKQPLLSRLQEEKEKLKRGRGE